MRDRDVRHAVRQMLAAKFDRDEGTRIVEEMGIWSGSVRIDLAVINGELSGFELKSERDTLERLPSQSDLYSRVFDRIVLVVAGRHVDKACGMIPSWWGVIVATEACGAIDLSGAREPALNPSPDPYLVAQLLWKEEALSVLDTMGMARGMRAKRVKVIHQLLAKELSYSALAAHVRSALKQRNQWLRQMVSCDLNMPINADSDPVL